CDLAEIIAAAVRTHTPAAVHSGVKMVNETGPGLWVNCDARRMSQAIGNLIINAIQAMAAHGGTLRVDSVPGSTTFMVALPKVPEYADLTAPSVAQLPVSEQTGPEQAVSKRAVSEQTGSEQAGLEQAVSEQAGPSGPVLPDRASAGPRPASPRS
ncbi:MAG: hypothetical protein QOC75_499, partial [Pseudonocardiales bacterium]|nr:hypothetical protein [Pseudonocardiales bacterium]